MIIIALIPVFFILTAAIIISDIYKTPEKK